MACKGVCRRPEYAFKPSNRVRDVLSLYASGAKRCTLCAAWVVWEGKFCPCCSLPLRTRPRNGVVKRRWRERLVIAAAAAASARVPKPGAVGGKHGRSG